MSPDREHSLYHLSAHYLDQETSAVPYQEAQRHIFEHDELALSVFRMQIRRLAPLPDGWFVTVLGDTPSEEHQAHFRRIFEGGEQVELPSEVMEALRQRRADMNTRGPWTERHYGSEGRRLL